MPAEAVIFDLDGVLVDSEPYWQHAFQQTANDHLRRLEQDQKPFTRADVRQFEGGRVNESLTRMLHARDQPAAVTDRLIERLTADVIADVSARFAQHPTSIGSSVATARWLGERGVPLAVASSSARSFIDAVLAATGLDPFVTVRKSALRLRNGKPHPEVYRRTVTALGLTPERCLAIEDSATGLAAALRAGIPTVWLRRGAPCSLEEGRRAAAEALTGFGADADLARHLVAVTDELSPAVVTPLLAASPRR